MFFYSQLMAASGAYSYEAVAAWTRTLDIFKLDKILIPINVNNGHWIVAMVSMTVPAVGFSDDSKRPRVKGTVLTGRIRKVRLSLKQLDYSLLYHHASGRAA